MPTNVVKTGEFERGYCALCLHLGTMERVVETLRTGRVITGWECARCGGVSVRPHQVCPVHGAGCRANPPLAEEVSP